jgi:hypothetical protein
VRVEQEPNKSTSPSRTPTTLGASAAPAASLATSSRSYKDGTYSAQGSYNSPGGPETVDVSLTLKSGSVTDSTVTTSGNSPTGKHYQSMFIDGYKSLVTGKSIDDINLSKVSGSSLTSEGFDNAVAKIKTSAKA